MEKFTRNTIWRDRKRPIFGLPLSFTVYELTEDRLFVKTGIFAINEDEIRLYRVIDINYKASIFQRLFGVGSILLATSDHTAGNLEIRSVKNPKEIKELLSEKVEFQRDQKRVVNREIMSGAYTDDSDDFNLF